jgi:hypothetical protein
VPRLKIHGSVLPLSQYVFMARYLVKHGENLSLTLPNSMRIFYNISLLAEPRAFLKSINN